MLLRVRLAHVRGGKRGHPDERLRHRLDVEQVERKAAAHVREPRAHGHARVVEIHGVGAEATERLTLGERTERDRPLRLHGRGRNNEGENDQSLHELASLFSATRSKEPRVRRM